MLVHTFNHLIPPLNGSPTVLSSASTSSYIPDVPYHAFAPLNHAHANLAHGISGRRDRRMRTAPYPLSVFTNVASLHPTRNYRQSSPTQRSVPLHSPRPIPLFNPMQAFTNVVADASVHPSLAFSPGAHGTILGPLGTGSDSASIPFGEVTATQLACMPQTMLPAHDAPSQSSASGVSGYSQYSNPSRDSGPYPQIVVPQVPSIPPISAVPPPNNNINNTNGVPYLPDAIPPEPSQMHVGPSGPLAPPSDSFPTPVELLNDLSLRDAEMEQKDRRRAERRKAQIQREAEALGFTPTDPDTISTHDKKRLYLDCLEQYVIYLHNELRLAGYEPVPVERVSSGRGLTSRSIRTMIVHLKSTTSKLHAQKREAELKCEELRAQLGADADTMAPSLVVSNPFTSATAGATKISTRQTVRTPTALPKTDSSVGNNQSQSHGLMADSNSLNRHSIATSGCGEAQTSLAAPNWRTGPVANGTGGIAGAGRDGADVQPGYMFP